MEQVRQHDQKLYELEVELVQLRSSLVSLTYDFDYNVVINYLLRNAQTAVHRVCVPSPGHFFSSGSPVKTHIFAIFKKLVKNLYIVYVPF